MMEVIDANKVFKFHLLFSCILFCSIQSFCQTKNKVSTVIKTNLLNLVAAGPSIAAEISFNKKWSFTPSYAAGKINYGDFGGITKYRTFTCEIRSHLEIFYFGGYAKYINKKVRNERSGIGNPIEIFQMGKNRNFTGNGISLGPAGGVSLFICKKVNIDFNTQLGYGHYFSMKDEYPGNLPSGNFLDARIALWIGIKL